MAIEMVGGDRLMWGSDDPFIGAGTEHVTQMNLAPAATAAILGGNALKLFGVDAAEVGKP